jgi:hypothetical protein
MNKMAQTGNNNLSEYPRIFKDKLTSEDGPE